MKSKSICGIYERTRPVMHLERRRNVQSRSLYLLRYAAVTSTDRMSDLSTQKKIRNLQASRLKTSLLRSIAHLQTTEDRLHGGDLRDVRTL